MDITYDHGFVIVSFIGLPLSRFQSQVQRCFSTLSNTSVCVLCTIHWLFFFLERLWYVEIDNGYLLIRLVSCVISCRFCRWNSGKRWGTPSPVAARSAAVDCSPADRRSRHSRRASTIAISRPVDSRGVHLPEDQPRAETTTAGTVEVAIPQLTTRWWVSGELEGGFREFLGICALNWVEVHSWLCLADRLAKLALTLWRVLLHKNIIRLRETIYRVQWYIHLYWHFSAWFPHFMLQIGAGVRAATSQTIEALPSRLPTVIFCRRRMTCAGPLSPMPTAF